MSDYQTYAIRTVDELVEKIERLEAELKAKDEIYVGSVRVIERYEKALEEIAIRTNCNLSYDDAAKIAREALQEQGDE